MSEKVALSTRIVPAQFSILPAHVQPQELTVSATAVLIQPLYLYRLVHAIHQPVPGQRRVVILSPGRVESPVLGYPIGLVVAPLVGVIILSGRRRRHLQREIRRLALLIYRVAPLFDDERAVDFVRYQKVRPANARALSRRPSHRNLSENYRRLRVSHVNFQGVDMGGAV